MVGYYDISSDMKCYPEVRLMQLRLNSIRNNYHYNWERLDPDGIYGPKTKAVVMAFQREWNITPASGKMGATTMRYIVEADSKTPMLKPATISSLPDNSKPYYDTRGLSEKYPILLIFDYTADFLGNMDEFLHETINYAVKLGKNDPKALQNRFAAFATKYDRSLKNLKQLFQRDSQNIIDENLAHSKVRVDSVRTYQEQRQILDAQRKISNAQRDLKIQSKTSMNFVNELKKFDLLKKIDSFLKSKGLSGEIKIEALKKVHLSGNIKIGAGTYLKVWSFKDLIVDVLSYREWGTDEWWAKLRKHIFETLDAIVIGYASAVIAEIAVGAVIALLGATVSAGWIVIIVAIVAMVVAALISYLLETTDVSFSEYALEGYKYISEYAKMQF